MSKIEITNYVIKNKKIPKDFHNYNIVQISDLHNESFGKGNIKLLDKINKINPQVIFITGDLIDGDSKYFSNSLELLKKLTEEYKVYYITGNHEQKVLLGRYKDLYLKYFNELKKLNAVHLDNDCVRLKSKDSYINLYGLTIPFKCYNYLFNKDKNTDLEENFIEENLGKANKDEYNILLSHTPFYFEDYEKWGADLTLAGHVHGGIIRLPFIGGLLSPNRTFFPKYDLGKFEINNSVMIVSKGLGGSKVLVRINCRPEVVNIILKSE
ncbi:metallophosphoesterase [Terrisporobacter sp.]|uniref:metallophosphoesterase n=1 Tax=Terrisporobacter sp. TaxID=1965305 RepID=UPI002630888E|nr:metallophosphoesterase [Terrisporobacter sp.]